mmetsp:Transcript_9012/g.31999  ORF Transcript_9012/g.31999 Transcript_9012/m.31999 type:complete len:113 (+) Transcript_9012:2529-2867(+)
MVVAAEMGQERTVLGRCFSLGQKHERATSERKRRTCPPAWRPTIGARAFPSRARVETFRLQARCGKFVLKGKRKHVPRHGESSEALLCADFERRPRGTLHVKARYSLASFVL